jgi:hypothetical protein
MDRYVRAEELRALGAIDQAWREQTIFRSRTEEQDTLEVREMPPAAHQDVSLITAEND